MEKGGINTLIYYSYDYRINGNNEPHHEDRERRGRTV